MRCKQAASLLLYVVTMVLVATGIAAAQGKFIGVATVKFLPGGRYVELAAPFSYIDSGKVKWSVPAGTRVDGASIPRALWSIIGSPFTGKYREASIIHDYYCTTKSRHWKAVHRVFLDGMLAQGVGNVQAKLMYISVYRFGPRWDFDVDACYCKGCPACASPIKKRIAFYQPTYNAEQFKELERALTDGTSTLSDLEDVADFQLNTEIIKP
jgi:Protein of unknown function (DUF1353)